MKPAFALRSILQQVATVQAQLVALQGQIDAIIQLTSEALQTPATAPEPALTHSETVLGHKPPQKPLVPREKESASSGPCAHLHCFKIDTMGDPNTVQTMMCEDCGELVY